MSRHYFNIQSYVNGAEQIGSKLYFYSKWRNKGRNGSKQNSGRYRRVLYGENCKMIRNNTKYIWMQFRANKRILIWGIVISFLVISLSLFMCETEKRVSFSEIRAREVPDAVYGAGYIFLLLYIVIILAASNYSYFKDETYTYEIYYGKNWASVFSRIFCQAGTFIGVFTIEMILAGIFLGNILELYFWKNLFIIALFSFAFAEITITFIWVTKNIVISAIVISLYFLMVGSLLPTKQISGIIAPDLAFYLWSLNKNSPSILIAMASLFFYGAISCFILLLMETSNKRRKHGSSSI